MPREIEVPTAILIPAIKATIALDDLTHGRKPSERGMLPDVSGTDFDTTYNMGIRLAKDYGHPVNGRSYQLDPLVEPALGHVQLSTEGGSSLIIETAPPAIEGHSIVRTRVQIPGTLRPHRPAVVDISSLTLNGNPTEPTIGRYVRPIVLYAQAAVAPQG